MTLKLLHTNKYFCNYTCKTLKSLNKKTLTTSAIYHSNIPDRSPKAVLNKPTVDDITIERSKPPKIVLKDDEIEQESAYDVAIRMRKAEKEKEDNDKRVANHANKVKYYKSCKLSHSTDEQLAKTIRKHVIFANKKLVVFNKPYGVASHAGDDKTENNIKSVLPIVSKMLHRLETNMTGVMLLSPDEEYAEQLQQMFRNNEILKAYWGVTLGKPYPMTGKIEIPLIRKKIELPQSRPHFKTKCSPFVRYDHVLREEKRLKKYKGTPSVTYYKNISSYKDISLVEFQPRTNFKHQIRAHSSEGLSCPLLGDHKYTCDTLRPQFLSKYLLDKLEIPQTKTRHLPLHMHLRKMLVPYSSENPNKPHTVFIAKVPAYMDRCLKVLRLRQDIKEDHHWHGLNDVRLSSNQDEELFEDPTNEQTRKIFTEEDCVKVYNQQIRIKYKRD